ncbi:MAG: CDP-diacylglycerol--glycerol-3-phosphate 3-phosphatidyltransferase [Gemmatimonadota bacterium]|nr:CDP-diacylglycerol--glycerol-3-phosphate 3-phosphatidyltransferase [Gemmatimonadota bacterium]MDH5760906.1 CDP-diacylglycerol--glycerol-3-phosphate 3-phosphatidyltransferase [Gemmatimonadota bacterium]
MSGSRLTVPNVITVARIAVCPVVFWLALEPGVSARFGAFALFLVAALSDVWDGYLARKHDWITDIGKLLDPIADKLLLASTFIPFYLISHRGEASGEVPGWGPLPLWVVLVIFGREILITVFRSYAVRRGVVIAAGKSGKHKALVQNLFSGGLLLWYPLRDLVRAEGWDTGPWFAWEAFHGVWITVTLGLAVVLTVYSMLDYLWRYRSVVNLEV